MSEINLKDFIKEAITQITDGIIEAQTLNSSKGCIINPPEIQTIGTPESITYRIVNGGNGGTISILSFDLAIAASEKLDGGAGLKVISGFLNVNGKIQKSDSNSVTNHLTFSIPVAFPMASEPLAG